MSKKTKILRPSRDPDHHSKRGVPYWWAPEWVRGTSSDEIHDEPHHGDIALFDGRTVAPCAGYGKIRAVKNKKTDDVELHMVNATTGKLSYIRGSIQEEFKKWHTDREIDYLLLGIDPDELIEE